MDNLHIEGGKTRRRAASRRGARKPAKSPRKSPHKWRVVHRHPTYRCTTYSRKTSRGKMLYKRVCSKKSPFGTKPYYYFKKSQ